jgi:hypothetical protein
VKECRSGFEVNGLSRRVGVDQLVGLTCAGASVVRFHFSARTIAKTR